MFGCKTTFGLGFLKFFASKNMPPTWTIGGWKNFRRFSTSMCRGLRELLKTYLVQLSVMEQWPIMFTQFLFGGEIQFAKFANKFLATHVWFTKKTSRKRKHHENSSNFPKISWALLFFLESFFVVCSLCLHSERLCLHRKYSLKRAKTFEIQMSQSHDEKK